VNRSDFEFVEFDPDRAEGATVRVYHFGANDSDIVSTHRSVEVPLTLDRPVFFSMVDTNAEGSQFNRYPKFLLCFTLRRIGGCLARLYSTPGYDPVPSTLPLSLDEGDTSPSDYQYAGPLNRHASNNGASSSPMASGLRRLRTSCYGISIVASCLSQMKSHPLYSFQVEKSGAKNL
jgi:hypothetical protein